MYNITSNQNIRVLCNLRIFIFSRFYLLRSYPQKALFYSEIAYNRIEAYKVQHNFFVCVTYSHIYIYLGQLIFIVPSVQNFHKLKNYCGVRDIFVTKNFIILLLNKQFCVSKFIVPSVHVLGVTANNITNSNFYNLTTNLTSPNISCRSSKSIIGNCVYRRFIGLLGGAPTTRSKSSLKRVVIPGFANQANSCFISVSLKLILNSGALVNAILAPFKLRDSTIASRVQLLFSQYFVGRSEFPEFYNSLSNFSSLKPFISGKQFEIYGFLHKLFVGINNDCLL